MLRIVTLVVTALFASIATAAPVRVIDGDTFALGETKIRIENIDAPEVRGAKCDAEHRLGLLAALRLGEMLAAGELELTRNPEEPRDADRYGRLLRRVLVDGVDAGEQLVNEGLARPWTGKRATWC